MKITEIRVKLLSGYEGDEKLRGFCSLTFDNEFVVRDIKIIEGARGLFVAMPSRRVTTRCPRCGNKNHLRARFCNECGVALTEKGRRRDRNQVRHFVDIAHPINQDTRQSIHDLILEEYQLESARAERAPSAESSLPETNHQANEEGTGESDRSMEAGG